MKEACPKFLEVMNICLQGKTVSWEELSDDTWKKLFRLADAQHVLPMVYEAVYRCPAAAKNPEFMQENVKKVIKSVGRQTRKTSKFLELYENMRNAGANPLVVKGLICRSLYPLPEHRSSVDEDVFVRESDFDICHKEILKYGLQPLEESKDGIQEDELAFADKKSKLYIELHRRLFSLDSELDNDINRYFDSAHDRAVEEVIEGVPVLTMGYTDHLLFLLLHVFKHFLFSGFGIRLVCDIILFANAYGKEIDWDYVMKCCRESNADKLAIALFQIGEKYLTFDPEKACYPSEWREEVIDEKPLLKDMLQSGVVGGSSNSRIHSSNITLRAMRSSREGKESNGMSVRMLFPTRAYMQKDYAYLERFPVLLPVAWASRIVKYGMKLDKKKNHPGRSLKIGMRRVELLKEYGIIKN